MRLTELSLEKYGGCASREQTGTHGTGYELRRDVTHAYLERLWRVRHFSWRMSG